MTVVTFVQACSSYEIDMEKTQTLPSTQPMNDEGTEEGLEPVPVTQTSTLAGISHGVKTQILRNMVDSLPPSSQMNESEMLGLSILYTLAGNDLIQPHRPRNPETEYSSRGVD